MKIILDFDNTLTNSSETACKVYELKTGRFADVNKITDYHFDNVMPLWNRQQQNDIFISKCFYDLLEPIESSIETLQRLKDEGHELVICSITRAEAMLYKMEWIRKHLGNIIDSTILIDNFKQGDSTVKMNKDIVCADILVDDHVGNLSGKAVDWKILFGSHAYSKGWNGLQANNWTEVYWLINMINKTKI